MAVAHAQITEQFRDLIRELAVEVNKSAQELSATALLSKTSGRTLSSPPLPKVGEVPVLNALRALVGHGGHSG